MEILVVLALAGGIGIWIAISHIAARLSIAKRTEQELRDARSETSSLKKQLADARIEYQSAEQKIKQRIQQQGQQIHEAKAEAHRIRTACDDAIRRKDQEVTAILNEASQGFPWLSRALAHYETLKDCQLAEHLETKKHPALIAAEHVRAVATRSREYRAEYHIARSRLDYYEALFPWLEEYVELDLDTLIAISRMPEEEKESSDPVGWFLAPGEYDRLTPAERNQLALDRYLMKKKSPWELGRDYERFIGYRLMQDGFDVEFHGILEGLSDLGRDLVAKRGFETRIVQCKYWAKHKTIHEKHIAQLFGTTVKYRIEHGSLLGGGVMGLFVTSTTLSDMAKAFAEQLGILVQENVSLEPYPMIKCNIGRDERGCDTYIYHLPMDQQYDRAKIVKCGECYVTTVAEAESLGFRRAWKWHPDSSH